MVGDVGKYGIRFNPIYMGPVSEQDMFSDLCKVNLFSKSSHDEDELQQTKTQAKTRICFCTYEQPQFSDTQNSPLALRQCI